MFRRHPARPTSGCWLVRPLLPWIRCCVRLGHHGTFAAGNLGRGGAHTSLVAASAFGIKNAHLDTTRGTTFHPLVVESAGAWEPHSAGLLWKISRAAAAREGADGEVCRNAARDGIACTFRACAVLCRRMELTRASSSWASPWHPSSLSDYLGGRLSRERQHRLQKHNFPIQSCGLPGVDCCLLHRHELPLTPFHGFCCLQQVNLPVQQVMFLPFVSILAGACGLTRAFYFCLFFLPWSLVTLVLLRRRDFALCRVSAIRAEENSQALAFSDLSFWEQVTLCQTVVCIIYTTWPHISYFLICSLLFLARLHQAPLNKEPFDFNLNHHVFCIRQWSSFLWMFLTQAAVSTMLLPSLPRGMAAEVEIKNDPRNLRWGKESKRRKKDPGYRIWL